MICRRTITRALAQSSREAVDSLDHSHRIAVVAVAGMGMNRKPEPRAEQPELRVERRERHGVRPQLRVVQPEQPLGYCHLT